MANIMLTDICNLKCPYCFANEFVNKDKNEISFDNYIKAKEFILKDGTKGFGLIGGEPTLHSHFKDILVDIINDNRIESVILYTNGLVCDQYLDELSHWKFKYLINLNSAEDIGMIQYQKVCQNLETMINDKYLLDRMTLGINFYKPNQDYGYIIELLKKFHFKKVRMSISVPNMEVLKNKNAHVYFLTMKETIKTFFKDCLDNDIIPFYDCNKMPSCLITQEETNMFQKTLSKYHLESLYFNNSIITDTVECHPVVDIRQDLTAVRCFGLSDVSKVCIEDFDNLTELRNYYLNEFDAYAYSTSYTKKCVDCQKRKILKCTGGCLAFKINDIEKLKSVHYQLMASKE